MQYRVSELAAASRLSVDTIRFYQGRGLIPQPVKSGRYAIYGDEHLSKLRRIRDLLEQGFTLAQIRRVVAGVAGAAAESASSDPGADAQAAPPGTGVPTSPPPGQDHHLLEALVQENVGDRTLSRGELGAAAGVPDALISAALKAGLIEPVVIGGEERFTQADLEMAHAGLELLGAGLPLDQLLGLAVDHASNVETLSARAIDLFDDHVRKAGGDDDAITRAFQKLLPQVTRLVALHFQRTLVSRALERLSAREDAGALEEAVAKAQSARLEIRWR